MAQDDIKIVVIGTGIAASVFTRHILTLASKENMNVKIIQIGHSSCNYCGGLMTNLASTTLKNLLNLDIPIDVELSKINRCIFINSYGGFEVALNAPLISMLRTSKFGEQGFDDSLRKKILEGLDKEAHKYLSIIDPATVTKIEPLGSKRNKVYYTIKKADKEIDADVVVIATGLRSLENTMMQKFSKDRGCIPPTMMDSCVTEIDTSKAIYDNLEHKTVIIDGVIKDCVVGIVSKRKGWITVTALNKVLTLEDLEHLFKHPSVKKYIDLPSVNKNLRCGIICEAKVFTAAAKNFYGDGWVIIGDLTGYGRILKDGYFAALMGAYYAANTIIHHGISKKAFEKHYHNKLKHFEFDNRIGMLLFDSNRRLKILPLSSKLFLQAGIFEEKSGYAGFIHAGIRAIITGELSYKIITSFFIFGWLKYLLTKSINFWRKGFNVEK
ncbi:MAG: hypothetical protein AABY84_00145 [Candidatus Firestonebacteria bacterium]